MDCKHERLRTVGDRVFCCGCGSELPLSFLMERTRREVSPAEKNQGHQAPAGEKADKFPTKKTRAKKAV